MKALPIGRLRAWEGRLSTRRVGWLALATAAMTAALIIYGAWVRASGSGLGCPDWPLCHGSALPGDDRASAIEYGHRLFAGVTMVMVAALAFVGFQRRREVPRAAGFLIASLLLILAQAGLGGAAVLTDLHGFIVLAHLALAMLIMGLLTAGGLAILVKEPWPVAWRPAPPILALAGAATILIGGSIVATNTGFRCLDVPFCHGGAGAMATWLHAFHRVLGVALLVGLAAAAMRLRGTGGLPIALVTAVGLLLVAQIGVGITALTLTLPEGLRVLHVALATLIWWGLVGLWALYSPSPKPQRG